MNTNSPKSPGQDALFPEIESSEAAPVAMPTESALHFMEQAANPPAPPVDKRRRAPNEKQRLAAELNWKKARMLPAYALLLSHTPAHLKPQLGYVFKACLGTLQKQADKAGIKGDYTKYIPHEQTAAYKRALKKYEKEQAKAASNAAYQ